MNSNIIISPARVNPKGGINFFALLAQESGLPGLIDRILGKRVKQATYSYSDIILSWIYAIICGADRLEDTQEFRFHLNKIPNSKCPSPDRVGYILKKLSVPSIKVAPGPYSERRKFHEFNINTKLNDLLLQVGKKLNLLNPSGNTLDYDNTLIEAEKYDSEETYMHFLGYCPGVALIDRKPVYIEGRNGGASPNFRIDESVRRCIETLRKNGIKIRRFRSDAAADHRKLMAYLEKEEIEFFIRGKMTEELLEDYKIINDWKVVDMGDKNYRVGSLIYEPGNTKKQYRVVISECLSRVNKKKNKYTKQDHTPFPIITTNTSFSNEEVLHFYNQRGREENAFKDLKHDFNWGRLPFSYLEQNTVFMVITAIAYLLYQYVVAKLADHVPFVKTSFRLKRFQTFFISTSCIWKNQQLIYYDEKYRPLIELLNHRF